jgi:regulatory protein
LKKSALEYALFLLGYRSRSEKELRERLLRRGYPEIEAERVLERLSQAGYIDDRALAAVLLRQARETKRLGRRGAAAYLARMGIPQALASEALDGYDEKEGARSFAGKKMKQLKGLPPEVQRRRLYGALARRGFSGETIRKLMKFEEEVEEK